MVFVTSVRNSGMDCEFDSRKPNKTPNIPELMVFGFGLEIGQQMQVWMDGVQEDWILVKHF